MMREGGGIYIRGEIVRIIRQMSTAKLFRYEVGRWEG